MLGNFSMEINQVKGWDSGCPRTMRLELKKNSPKKKRNKREQKQYIV